MPTAIKVPRAKNLFSARIKHKQSGVVFRRQRQFFASVGAGDRSLDRAPNDFGFGKAKTVAFVGEDRSPHFHTLPTKFREDPNNLEKIFRFTVALVLVAGSCLSTAGHSVWHAFKTHQTGPKMINSKFLLSVFTMLVFCSLSSEFTHAQSQISSSAIEKSKRTIGSRSSGKYILQFVHMGATYTRHTFLKAVRVNDRNGKAIPGEFAVIYNFVWDASGLGNTKLAFFCDRNGRVKGIRVLSTSGVVNSPFTFADATIQILGQSVLEAFSSKLTSSEKRTINALIRSANSKGLLVLALSLR